MKKFYVVSHYSIEMGREVFEVYAHPESMVEMFHHRCYNDGDALLVRQFTVDETQVYKDEYGWWRLTDEAINGREA